MATSALVALGLYDVTARADSVPSCGQQAAFTPASNLTAEPAERGKYITLEENFFLLDGSFTPFPEEDGNFGLWSAALCGADGTFEEPPVLTISFSGPHTSAGLTFHFDRQGGGWPVLLDCRWYDGSDGLLDAVTFSPDSADYFLDRKAEGYRKLVLTVRKMNAPFRYFKLDSIEYGFRMVFDGESLLEASVLEEADPSGGTVSVNTLDFTGFTQDGSFSMLNPSGRYSAIQQGQKAEVTAVQDDECRPFGVFYLDSWESSGENGVRFTAVDAVGVLEQQSFPGGMYEQKPAGELLEELFSGSGIYYEAEGTLTSKTFSGYLARTNRREALQQIAFAVGGTVVCGRDGTISIAAAETQAKALLSAGRKFTGQSLKLDSAVTEIQVASHQYCLSGERQTLYEQPLSPGRYQVEFSAPAGEIEAQGAELISANANGAEILVSEQGNVILSGRSYAETTQTAKALLEQTDGSVKSTPVTVESATLLDREAAQQAAGRLAEYYRQRCVCEFSAEAGQERPGWMVQVEGIGGAYLRGRIERMETDLTGGMISALRVRGEWIETLAEWYAGELFCGEGVTL